MTFYEVSEIAADIPITETTKITRLRLLIHTASVFWVKTKMLINKKKSCLNIKKNCGNIHE